MLCCVLGVQLGFARVEVVRTTSHGQFCFVVRTCDTRITIDETGGITGMNVHGSRDYFDSFDDPEKEGKPRRIGDISIDYYDSFDNSAKEGKIKRVGDVVFDYYDTFDNSAKRGKLKRIGDLTVDYYDTFDNVARRGKIKRIGTLEVDYYDTFDGRWREGRLRRIGDREFDYHTDDRPESFGLRNTFEAGGIRFRVCE